MKRLYLDAIIAILILALALTSCNEAGNYYDAIPHNSKALVRISGDNNAQKSAIQLFINNEISDDCGIDFSQPVYMYESLDGNLGICAKVSDEDNLDDFFGKLKEKGNASEIKEKNNCKVCVVNHSFLSVYNSEAILVTGPTLPDNQEKQSQRMARLLELDPEKGIGTTDIFASIEESKAPIMLISQVSAMPKQIAMPFLLGAPTGTSSDDVILSAEVTVNDSTLTLNGSTNSANLNISQGMDNAKSYLHEIQSLSANDNNAISIMTNAKGQDIIHIMEGNKDFQSILNSENFRTKLSSIDGNMLISMTPESDPQTEDVKYKVDVTSIENSNSSVADQSHLIVTLNLSAINADALSIFKPFLGGITKIVYKTK